MTINRTKSTLAQSAFSLTNRLQHLAHHGYKPVRPDARLLRKLAVPCSRRLGSRHIVSARLYGHELLMPAEHPLAFTLARFPQYNRPLGLAARAIFEAAGNNSPILVIDVGANIGETVAIIEQQLPGVARYLCIEADREISELCKMNHLGNDRVYVERCFIGEDEGTQVWLQDDGRANPSTKRSVANSIEPAETVDRLVRLDTVADRFEGLDRTVSLLKIDTEGYDFSVLRSASHLLRDYRPALYFEWFPKLLLDV